MQYPVHLPGFEGRNIVVAANSMLSGPKLLIDGQPAPKGAKRGQYILRRHGDDREVVLSFKTAFPDPVPLLIVDGQTVRLVRPLAWYEWILAGFPLLLLMGGAIGAFLGVLATTINASILRSPNLPAPARYGLSLLIGLLSYVAMIVIAMLLFGDRYSR